MLSESDSVKVSEFIEFNQTFLGKIYDKILRIFRKNIFKQNYFETFENDIFILNRMVDIKTKRWEFRIFDYYPNILIFAEEYKWFGNLNY